MLTKPHTGQLQGKTLHVLGKLLLSTAYDLWFRSIIFSEEEKYKPSNLAFHAVVVATEIELPNFQPLWYAYTDIVIYIYQGVCLYSDTLFKMTDRKSGGGGGEHVAQLKMKLISAVSYLLW